MVCCTPPDPGLRDATRAERAPARLTRYGDPGSAREESPARQAYADLQAAQAQIIEQEDAGARVAAGARDPGEHAAARAAALPGLDIGARMVAARMVGGDFYDVIELDANRLP